MGKKKIVLDTNIYISAFGWYGAPRTVFERIFDKEFELITSFDLLFELERVLNYPKFNLTETQKQRFLELIAEIATLLETRLGIDAIKNDPTDNRILECALEGNAGYIITGDEHLLKLKNFRGIKILSPEEFLRM